MVKNHQSADDEIYEIIQAQALKKINSLYPISDMTYEQISEKTGIDIETLRQIWEGECEITPEITAKILDAYDYYGKS